MAKQGIIQFLEDLTSHRCLTMKVSVNKSVIPYQTQTSWFQLPEIKISFVKMSISVLPNYFVYLA